MKAAVLEGINQLVVRHDVPEPEPNDYQALCDILACATCNGTDMHHIEGRMTKVYPSILGHESVGRVTQLGAKVRNLKVGDLVFRATPVLPGQKLREFSSSWGGFSERGAVTDVAAMQTDGQGEAVPAYARFQQKITAAVDPCEATVLIPLKEALYWLRTFDVGSGTKVLVLGDGPVSQTFAFWLKHLGCDPIVVWGRRQQRRDAIRKVGATHAIDARNDDFVQATRDIVGAGGFDFIIDAIGSSSVRKTALSVLSDSGTLGWYGVDSIPAEGEQDPRIERHKVDESATHDEVMKRVAEGGIDLKLFYDRMIPLDQIVKGFTDIAAKRVTGKLIVRCTEE